MSLAQSVQSTWGRWLKAAEVYRDRRQLIILLMGFASGMPFLLTGATLTYWMSRIGVDLTTIGLFALVGTPYAFKFVWAPLVDQLPLPLLDRWLGRRRSWMLLAQVGIWLSVVLAGLERSRPRRRGRPPRPRCSSPSSRRRQDIAVDAYRIEILRDEEQGAGAATTQLGYRIALLDRRRRCAAAAELAAVAGRASAWSRSPWSASVIGHLARRPEPSAPAERRSHDYGRWVQAGGGPSLRRILGRIAAGSSSCCSRCSTNSAMRWAARMAQPFYVEMGFTGREIAGVTKIFGFVATIVGGLAGGIVVARYGAVQGAAGRRHPAGGHQPPVRLASPSGRMISPVLTLAITADNFTGALGGVGLHRLTCRACAPPAWPARNMRC